MTSYESSIQLYFVVLTSLARCSLGRIMFFNEPQKVKEKRIKKKEKRKIFNEQERTKRTI